jgi:hypothetical protein
VQKGLAGVQVQLEIQLAASQLAQEQVVPQTHCTNIRYCSRQYEHHSQFRINNFIPTNTKATELHADFLEANTKVIRKCHRLVSLEPSAVSMRCTTRSRLYRYHVLRDCLIKATAAHRFLGLWRR